MAVAGPGGAAGRAPSGGGSARVRVGARAGFAVRRDPDAAQHRVDRGGRGRDRILERKPGLVAVELPRCAGGEVADGRRRAPRRQGVARAWGGGDRGLQPAEAARTDRVRYAPTMALIDVTLEDESPIVARYRVERFGNGLVLLVVAWAGEYRHGSAGAPDARRMTAQVAAGLAQWSADAVVLDLSALSYRWGDGLMAVFEAAARGGDTLLPRLVAIVAGPDSRAGLASLCVPETLFDDLATAVADVRHHTHARADELERIERTLVLAIVVRDDLTPSAAIELAAGAPTQYLAFVTGDWRTMTWQIECGAAVVRRATPAQLAALASLERAHVIAEPDERGALQAVVLGARTELPAAVRELPAW